MKTLYIYTFSDGAGSEYLLSFLQRNITTLIESSIQYQAEYSQFEYAPYRSSRDFFISLAWSYYTGHTVVKRELKFTQYFDKLERLAETGKDILLSCESCALHPQNLFAFLQYKDKQSKRSEYQCKIIFVVGRQDLNVEFYARHFWGSHLREYTLQRINFFLQTRHDILYQQFCKIMGVDNCTVLCHNHEDPAWADDDLRTDFCKALGIAEKTTLIWPKACLPQTQAGLEIRYSLKELALQGSEEFDIQDIYVAIRHMEDVQELQPVYASLAVDRANILSMAQPHNKALATILHKENLFTTPPLKDIATKITADNMSESTAIPLENLSERACYLARWYLLFRGTNAEIEKINATIKQDAIRGFIPIDTTFSVDSPEMQPLYAKIDEIENERWQVRPSFKAPDPLTKTVLTPAHCASFVEHLPKLLCRRLLLHFRTHAHLLYTTQKILWEALEDYCNTASELADYRLPVEKVQCSVATLAYNQEQYIEDCIKSVIAQQTTFPVEHVIVDDCSTDSTTQIILHYALQYPHIRFIPLLQKSASCVGENVENLFSHIRTEYVALCDGDDYFTDINKLQKQVDFLQAQAECSMCFHPVRVVYEDGSKRGRIYPPRELMPRGVRPFYYASDLFKANFIQTNSAMYRWRFSEGLPSWFKPNLTPSDWYWHLLHAEMGKIGFIDEIMSAYRRHTSSLYYSSETEGTSIPHRLMHGLNELETYAEINTHFNRRYERAILSFTNNVLVDFLRHARETGDESFLQEAGKAHPGFMAHFLKEVRIVRGTKPQEV